MPKLPQLETCCFCCSTETGSKIIGWLMTIGNILLVFSTGYVLIQAAIHVGEEIPSSHDGSIPPYKIKTIDVWEAALAFIMAIVSLMLGIYLLVGIMKRNMSYVKFWLTIMTIYLIFLACLIVLAVVQSITSHNAGTLITELINFCILCYCVLVVYSYYRDQRQTPAASY